MNRGGPPTKKAKSSAEEGETEVINLLSSTDDDNEPSTADGQMAEATAESATNEPSTDAKATEDDETKGDSKPAAAPKFARPAPTPSKPAPADKPETQAGHNFGRFAHKKEALTPPPAAKISAATTARVSFPAYEEHRGGAKLPSKNIPEVPSNGKLFDYLDIPYRVSFFGTKMLPTGEALTSQKGEYRRKCLGVVEDNAPRSWRWSMMTDVERMARQVYYAHKKLLEHTDVYKEAFALTKKANELLTIADQMTNKTSKLSRAKDFDVRDPNKKDL